MKKKTRNLKKSLNKTQEDDTSLVLETSLVSSSFCQPLELPESTPLSIIQRKVNTKAKTKFYICFVPVKTLQTIFCIIILLSIGSCKDSNGKSIFAPTRVEPPKIQDRENPLHKENVGRDLWQKPEFVLNKLGDIEGKVIADIGAGTGYFVVRLSYRKAKVLAIEIDPVMIDYIDSFKEILPAEVQSNITTRLAHTDNPMLKDGEVDIAIIINTISYIDKLEEYLATLKKGIKPKGSIMILDYKNKIIDIQAPPLDDRVSIGKIQTYLAKAGYKNIIADDTSLDYQYIITANVE